MTLTFRTCLAVLALAALTACTEEPQTAYPLSGAPCGPGDPVQGLDAHDCSVPPVASGT